MKPCASVLLTLLATVVLSSHDAAGQYVWGKDIRNPILSGEGTAAWDHSVLVPCVIFNSDSARYEMWYNAMPPGGSMGFAVSSDGITWKRDANPVLSTSPGQWDAYSAAAPSVIRESGHYKMWYTGVGYPSGAGSIGYATSSDGRTWVKYSGNPVLTAGSSAWEGGAVSYCSVIKSSAGYVMFYTGCVANANLNRIGRATSADGITWQRDTLHNPVLNVGGSDAWDGNIFLPAVLNIHGKYYMWYTAEKVIGEGGDGIGVATSSDSGKTWVKYAQNPVLTMGSPYSWEGSWIELGSVLLVGDTVHMWYDGGSASIAKVGHATSPYIASGIADEHRQLPQSYMLEQNYPNPFNPSTTIGFGVSGLGSSYVRLSVYDMLGREVAVLVNERRDAGYHEVKFDGANLASGVYLYRLQAGEFVQTKRLLLLK